MGLEVAGGVLDVPPRGHWRYRRPCTQAEQSCSAARGCAVQRAWPSGNVRVPALHCLSVALDTEQRKKAIAC